MYLIIVESWFHKHVIKKVSFTRTSITTDRHSECIIWHESIKPFEIIVFIFIVIVWNIHYTILLDNKNDGFVYDF